MGKAEALYWLATRPHLRSKVSDAWLDTEGAKRRGLWHPLYDLLQASPNHPDMPAMLDAIEAALAADLGGDVASRGRRLVAGGAGDYWSAISELYLAAALRACGLEATLGSPDVVAVDPADGSGVAIELTSIWRTADTTRLTEIIAGGWTGRSQPAIVIPDETVHVSTPVADRILAAMLEADQRLHATNIPAGPAKAIREVDISTIISPSRVRAFLNPRSPQFMATRSGPRHVIVDPWPDLEYKVLEKERQLASHAHALVAVDGTHMHVTAYEWAERVKEGLEQPALNAPPNIAGVVLFWVDLRQHAPFRSVFVRNSNWTTPDPAALIRTLDCFGTSKRRLVIAPTPEELQRMFGEGGSSAALAFPAAHPA